MDWTQIVLGILVLLGVWLQNNKTQAVIQAVINEKLEQTKTEITELKTEQQKHNKVIERTYHLEEKTALHDAELKRQNERLKALEQGDRK